MISFTAHCARGHDRVEFTDPLEFERHMTGTHKARKPSYGMPDTPRQGGLPNRYLRPAKAPKNTRKLSAVLEKAAGELVRHGRGVGVAPMVADWHTDDLVPLEDVRTGDVFKLGRHEYVCHDREAWLVTCPEANISEPKRPSNIEDRLGVTVRIVKRAA